MQNKSPRHNWGLLLRQPCLNFSLCTNIQGHLSSELQLISDLCRLEEDTPCFTSQI